MNFAERVLSRLTTNNIQEAMRTAARDTIPDMTTRIFVDGQNSVRGAIGRYSSKPITVSKAAMPKVVSGTRSNDKSVYFAGGYAQYKRELGFNNVNWKVLGNLMRDFATPKETARGRSLTYTVKRQENQDKLDYLENHFSTPVTALTTSERQNLNKVFLFELEKKLFQGE